MPSFDEAFRQERTAQQSAHVAQRSTQDRYRRFAEDAAAHIDRALADFSNALNGKVAPTAVRVGEHWDPKRSNRRPIAEVVSPPGYRLRHGYSLDVVTPDGRYWTGWNYIVKIRYRSGILREPSWRDETSAQGGYVTITADTLLNGAVSFLGAKVQLDPDDGHPYVNTGTFGDVEKHRIEDLLARCAHELITST